MRFTDKLSRLAPMPRGGSRRPARPLAQERAASEPDPGQDRLQHLRALMGESLERSRRRHRQPRAAEPQALPVGQVEDCGYGPMHRVCLKLSPEHRHGHARVADALRVQSDLVGTLGLDLSLTEVDLSRMLVLDTETTGLLGGAGTVPFLIGLSYFQDGALHVEQLFLRNLGEETPLLHQLRERIAQASCVVSYNGKTFDWPLLRSRFIMNRVPAPVLPPHLDLLHCARRLWKARLPSVRLVDVERELLGFAREGDVEGALIPTLYLNYLRGGDPAAMVSVLRHNEWDLVALPAMLGLMGLHFVQTCACDDPRDQLAFARVAARAGDPERALRFAEAALRGAGEDALLAEASLLCAELVRRGGDAQGALDYLEEGLRSIARIEHRSPLHLAASKLCEHRLGVLSAARDHALHSALAEGDEAQDRRLRRLARRLSRLPRAEG